jgi:hypothetical protein
MDDTPIVHVHDDDLELYVRGRLEPQRVSTLDSHLVDCQTCRARLAHSLGLQLVLHPLGKSASIEKGRRSEPRFEVGDDAIVQQLSPLSLDRREVKIVDVSRNGLGILAPEAVMPGTIVQVRININVELGEVRYCLDRGGQGYRIGLRLGDQF